MTKILSYSKYAIAFLVMLCAFQYNLFQTTSDQQFKTWRDGSEALVLGKVFADLSSIDTGHSNMGFIEKEKITKTSDVLAIYPRVDHPGKLVTANLTDDNWKNGISKSGKVFLLTIAAGSELGYASNEVQVGQVFTEKSGEPHTITGVTRAGNYLNVSYDGFPIPAGKSNPPEFSLRESRAYAYDPYPQQVGIQALALSFAYQHLPLINSFTALQFLMSAMMALVLTLLIREINLTVSTTFAVVFFLCMVGSPWVVAIARNLYWASFLWFLPTVMAMQVYRSTPKTRKYHLAIVLYGAAVFLKCLAGYEYISSIVLMSLMVFMIDPFRAVPILGMKQALRTVFKVGIVAVLGFALAVLVHAMNRADTFAEGISQTLGWDALKYSALGRFTGVVVSGPNYPLSYVLSEYTNEWKTPVLFWFEDRRAFNFLMLLTALSIAAQFYTRDANARRDAALVLVTLLAPMSWFVLMQKHSAIHVHLNYVLWYFGFIPACVFVVVRGYTLIACNLRAARHNAEYQ